ncbi:MAG TPA: hypothetical protein VK540_30100 [Polyangiaceae bacterium]|nr:hypothetical protein [Polyangiaceae bacterium]
MSVSTPPRSGMFLARTAFVLSAAAVALGLRSAAHKPLAAALVALVIMTMVVPAYLSRRRVRQVLRSGDVHSVLTAWSGNIAKLPYRETMEPLITAAAFASCGWVDQARTALRRSARGPAWDAALEHRLFVETLLDAFEGDRAGALAKAERLATLPLPFAGPLLLGRVRVLRDALAAFARAFAHVGTPSDVALLERASKKSPLIHWAMLYAAAVVSIDLGQLSHAKKLLASAPPWPEGSAFCAFHEELMDLVEG